MVSHPVDAICPGAPASADINYRDQAVRQDAFDGGAPLEILQFCQKQLALTATNRE